MNEAQNRCPVCGRGELADIVFTELPRDEEMQQAESRQVAVYDCGHEVKGPRLEESAGPDSDLDVERRTSEDTVPPPPRPSG